MSGIAGILYRDGRPVDMAILRAMAEAMKVPAPNAISIWCQGLCGFVCVRRADAITNDASTGPFWMPDASMAFAAAGRIDARDELGALIGLSESEATSRSDEELMLRTYMARGDRAAEHMLGDWSFAAWHSKEQRLHISRDPSGLARMNYFVSDRCLAFASSKRALLALDFIPRHADPYHIAYSFRFWVPPEHSTAHRAIRWLPVGRCLTVTPEREEVSQYWSFSPRIGLGKLTGDDCVEGLREVFTRAVKDRIRATAAVGVALSGGLDSGFVAATAAPVLRARGSTLRSLTHVPVTPDVDVGGRIGDERSLVEETVRQLRLDASYINSADIDPVAAIDRMVSTVADIQGAAANAFWLFDLLAAARAQGLDTLLLGQGGNWTVSWSGPGPRRSLATVARFVANPRPAAKRWALRLRAKPGAWPAPNRVLNDTLAREQGIVDTMCRLPEQSLGPDPGRSLLLRARLGLYRELAEEFGIDVCDPMTDRRVIEFCWSLRDAEYRSSSGVNRWLARRALVGLLPESVVKNSIRGQQSADMILRLRRWAIEVDSALDRCRQSARVGRFIDHRAMEEMWARIRRSDDNSARRDATRLCRGIQVGLFLERFPRMSDHAS